MVIRKSDLNLFIFIIYYIHVHIKLCPIQMYSSRHLIHYDDVPRLRRSTISVSCVAADVERYFIKSPKKYGSNDVFHNFFIVC